MFDLQVPSSMQDLPRRFVGLCWDDWEPKPVRPKMPPEVRRERERERARLAYARDREAIAAARKAARALLPPRVKQSPEERAAQKARYWATNRERINARRRKVAAKNKTRTAVTGRAFNQ